MQKTINISRELRATRRRENVAGYLFMAPSLLYQYSSTSGTV